MATVLIETCDECGFDAEKWSDAEALAAIAGLPAQYVQAVNGLTPKELFRRPVADQWSIGEYADHVREVLFGMRFLLDVAKAEPGSDLGDAPSSPFSIEPRRIDMALALEGIEGESQALLTSLTELSPDEWSATVTLDGTDVDAHWIARHSVHDATHHLFDIDRLRHAL